MRFVGVPTALYVLLLIVLAGCARMAHDHGTQRVAAAPGLSGGPLDNSDGRWNGVHYVDGDIIIDGKWFSQMKRARLRGRVFAQDTQVPIAGVTVECAGRDTIQIYRIEESFTAVTDAQGNYEIGNLPPDTYMLYLSTPSVAPANSNLNDIWIDEGEDKHFDVPVTGSGVLEATVIDADSGTPLAGADVSICSELQLGSCIGPTTKTDDRGYFKCIGMDAGEYSIDSFEKNEISYNVVRDEKTRHALLPGEHVILDVHVQRSWHVEVELVDKHNEPVSGIGLSAYEIEPTGQAKLLFDSLSRPSSEANCRHLYRPDRRLRFDACVMGLNCAVSAEVNVPQNYETNLVLVLPCAKSDIPPQPDDLPVGYVYYEEDFH